MGEFVTAAIIKILASTATSALMALCSKVAKSPVFDAAVKNTVTAFPAIEVERSLRKWCDSVHFGEILNSVKTNGKSVPDTSIVNSFIEAGEFYHDITTEQFAAEILCQFFTALEEEMLKSTEGNITLAGIQREMARDVIRFAEQGKQETIAAVNVALAKTEEILAVLQDNSITPQALEEKILHARIDDARETLKSGRPKTARDRLLSIRSEISGKNPTQSVLFRLATNLGCCAIQMGDERSAATEFRLAHVLEPLNPIAVVNASCIALREGDVDEALRLAVQGRTLSPEEGFATAQYIQVLFAQGKKSEVFDLLSKEKWINSNTHCCVTIGAALLQEHKYAEAEVFLRTAYQKEPSSMNAAMHFAQALMHPLDPEIIGETFLSWRVPANFIARLEEAQIILSNTIASNTKSEQQRLYSICLGFRANIRRMLGNEAGSVEDCKLALTEDAKNYFALQILGLSLMREGRNDEAIQAFESIEETRIRHEVTIPLSAAYIKAGKSEKALSLLESWAQSSDRPDGLLEAADLLFSAYDALGRSEDIERLVSDLRNRWPSNPVALAAIGHQLRRQGRGEEAIITLSEALSNATGAIKDFISLTLADYYYSSGSFDKALDFYQTVAELKKDDSVTLCYLICLFKTGFYEAALELAKKLRGTDGEPSDVAGEIEALLLEKMGDLPAAQRLFERLSELYPQKRLFRIEAIECAVRRGRNDLAREMLQQVNFEDIRDEGELLMKTAQLRAVTGMDDVLRYAYQARRVAYSNPDVHAAYVGLFLRKDIIQPGFDETAARKNCAVIIDTETVKSCFIILDESVLYPERGEISVQQAESLNLIGRVKGDQFILRRSARGEIKCSVIEVQSKYVHAFQETVEKFPAFFPTEPLIEPVTGSAEDIKELLFTQIDEQESRFERIVSFYSRKQLSIEQLAKLGNRSLIQMWGILVGGKYCKLFASSGTDHDRQQEAALLRDADALVLDLTSLLTFAHLGLLKKLSLRFRKLITAQPVLDAIIGAIEVNASRGPSTTIAKRGPHYIRDEVTADRVAKYAEFLQSIRDFIVASVELLPVASFLKEKTPDLTKWQDMFGPISTACVLAAQESSTLLCSDDQILRARAALGMGVKSVWSQSTLVELLRVGVISGEEHTEATGELVFLNHTFVSVNDGIVMHYLRKAGFHVADEVSAILGMFCGPDCTFESAAVVLSQVVKNVWLEYLLFEPRVEIVEAILEVIVAGRPAEKSITLFLALVKERFFLMHEAMNGVVQIVQDWKKRKVLREGIILTD